VHGQEGVDHVEQIRFGGDIHQGLEEGELARARTAHDPG
jgi:hypothetical protein